LFKKESLIFIWINGMNEKKLRFSCLCYCLF
jgi:hypothetical protein